MRLLDDVEVAGALTVGGVPVAPAGYGVGGDVSYVGGYVYHTFLNSGTFTVVGAPLDVEYLVGGGGGGATAGSATWHGCSGAAGVLRTGSAVIPTGDTAITVGAGGTGTDYGITTGAAAGGSSSIAGVATAAGGGGGIYESADGASNSDYPGGDTGGSAGDCGGGAGAGAAGSTYLGGAGASHSFAPVQSPYGVGGSGWATAAPPIATAHSGNGAHGVLGAGSGTEDGLDGGSGVVCIRYPNPNPAGGRVTLSGDVSNANGTANTLADVTGLSFPVVAGNTYHFRFVIAYTAAAPTTGSRWTINGPAFTALGYTSSYTLTATTVTVNNAIAYGIPTAANATSLAGLNVAIVEGFVKPSADGSVVARFASEVSASAVVAKAGSFVDWEQV